MSVKNVFRRAGKILLPAGAVGESAPKLVIHRGGEMKSRWIAGLGLGLWAFAVMAQEPADLKTPKDKQSYAIGIQIARSVQRQGVDVDPNLVALGLKDALTNGKLLMTDDEVRTTIAALQQEMKQKQMDAMAAVAAGNKKEGDTFLAENAKKDGVVVLPSGLQYKILKAGAGKKPAETDTVLCNYRGTFINGTEFDSSTKAGKPVSFSLNGVIPGFREALQLMPEGSKWQIFVPSSLGYGERGAANVIGPNATLIFEIELVSIQEKP
jgi:FKBP-type peptidyl-prolyl cis-trans isomerase